MKEYYESLSDLEVVRLIETEDGLVLEAFNICLEIISERGVSDRSKIRLAKKIYEEKLTPIYLARGFYPEKMPELFSFYLNAERKRQSTIKVFKEVRKMLKDFNKDLPDG